MPEIAEVEIMARQLAGWTDGKRLTAVRTRDPAFEGMAWDALEGQAVCDVRRRGKYALVRFDGGHTLVIHYRMTGKTVLDPDQSRRARLWLCFGAHDSVAFVDVRRFGTLDIMRTASVDGWIAAKGLGPEPWPESRSAAWWQQQLADIRSPIKVAMMRQDRVAGLGNIAATEILFRSGIHPEVRPSTLDEAAWRRIAEAVPTFIEHTIAEEGGAELQYVNQGGEGSFAVYGKRGEPCPACGETIVRLVQSGRGTYFCPECQPLS